MASSEGQTVLGWQHELPLWVWVTLVVGSLAIAGWSYAGLIGRGWPKVVLAVNRAILLFLLAAILAGPMWVEKREEIEPDWLLMLVDHSASMRIQDAYVVTDGTRRPVSRHEAMQDLMNQNAALFGPDQLGRDRRIVWFGFDAQAYPIESSPFQTEQSWAAPDGQTTLLRTAIEQALQRASGNPVSGIVLLTDGRSPQSTGSDLIRILGQQAVSLFPVPFGAAKASVDLSIARLEAPSKAFVNDPVPVTVWIDRYPIDAQIDLDQLRVQLVDVITGEVLDQVSPGEHAFSAPVHLAGKSEVAGETTWRVVLTYDSNQSPLTADSLAKHEVITDNNQQDAHLEFVDRPIRVLYIEGYPRWEYRYLTNVLVREKSVLSSVVLISADQGFAQEGDVSITRMPQSRKEIQRFDVIIIGDVPADYFSLSQQTLLRAHVAEGGAGVLWIGGVNHTPYSYDATQLAELLPMRRPGLTQIIPSTGPMNVTPTAQAESLSVLTLQDLDASLGADVRTRRWPTDLPGLRWVQAIGEQKPSVDVLATATTEGADTSVPLVVRHRYGSGQILYVASDDTWRWRFGRGDLYFQQFWIQLVRFLGRHRIQEDTRPVRLSVSHQRIELDQAAVVTLHIRDAMIQERRLPRVQVSVTSTTNNQHESSPRILEQLELLPEHSPEVSPSDPGSGRSVYKAIWQPRHTGKLTLTVSELVLRDMELTQPIEVFHPDDELRQPKPDHDRLQALADLSGGKVVFPDRIEELSSLIPNRARRTPNDIRYPLWKTPFTLLIVIVLLTTEWVGRKLIQLA